MSDNLNTTESPIGSITAYMGEYRKEDETKNNKWLLCDGRPLKTSEFPVLFETIKNSYGTSEKDRFLLPNLQGLFLRGTTISAPCVGCEDPDAEKRTPMVTGANDKKKVGSLQLDEFKSHTHTTNAACFGNVAEYPKATANTVLKTGASIDPSGGNETRPKNAYVYWLMRVK